jgi:hypothetical protein
MLSRFFLGAYWPAREEAIEQCADRLLSFFSKLATSDSALAIWYELGRSRKQALERRANVGDRTYLLKLLDRGRNRRNVDRKVNEELGFRIGLWNGRDEGNDASLGITCGLYWGDGTLGAGICNCVTLDLPEDLGELKQAGRMSGVLAAVVQAWEPDWAGVMSREAMNARAFDAKIPFVDWMVYVPRRIDNVPPPSSVVQLENGSLIVVQPDPPAVNSAADQENIRRIENILR